MWRDWFAAFFEGEPRAAREYDRTIFTVASNFRYFDELNLFRGAATGKNAHMLKLRLIQCTSKSN